jgi:hypothetical protein
MADGGLFLGFVIVALGTLVAFGVWLVWRAMKKQRRLRVPEDDRTLLERAQDAAAQLSDDDRGRLRRWLETWGPRTPQTGAGDAVTPR